MTQEIKKNKRISVFAKTNGSCYYCGCLITLSNFQVDHISPRNRHLHPSLRGSNDISNLAPSCRSCNASKSNFTVDVWRKELELKYIRLIRDSSQFRILERFGVISKNKSVVFHFEKSNIYGRTKSI